MAKRAELTAIISADARAFYRTMGQVGAGSKMALKIMAGASVAAAAAWGAAITATAAYGDVIDKMSKRTGLGTTALQRLKYAAELSGASLEDLETATRRMQSTIYDAGIGNKEAVRSMRALGLSAADLKTQTPEAQLLAMLDAMARLEDPTRRAALAQDVFGRSGTMMLPMLDKGSAALKSLMAEADDLKLILSPEQVKNAAEFNDALSRVKGSLAAVMQQGVAGEMGAVAAALNDIAGNDELFNALVTPIKEMSAGFAYFVQQLAALAKDEAAMRAIGEAALNVGQGFRYATESLAELLPMMAPLSKAMAFVQKNAKWMLLPVAVQEGIEGVVNKVRERQYGKAIPGMGKAPGTARVPAPSGVPGTGGEVLGELRRLNAVVAERLPEAG